MADLPINQLSASNTVSINDFAAFDIYNPIDGNYYTYKVSFGTIQNILSAAIGGNFSTQLTQLQNSINVANNNINNKVSKSGDTMTGGLTINSGLSVSNGVDFFNYLDVHNNTIKNVLIPVDNYDGVPKIYVDNLIQALSSNIPNVNGKLNKSGDTMTGSLSLAFDPTNPNESTTKRYVDNRFNALSGYLPLSGGAMSGNINLSNTHKVINVPSPIASGDIVNKQYVDGLIGGVYLPLSGGTMIGNINLGNSFRIINSPAPSSPGDLTNKTYVDGLVGGFLKADGSVVMTGNLNANNYTINNLNIPTLAGQATNKFYVDSSLSAYLPLSGGAMTGNFRLSGYTEEVVTAPIAGNVATINLNLGNNFVLNLNANVNSFNIIYPTNGKAGCSFTLYVVQGGSFLISWIFSQSGVSNPIPTFAGTTPSITIGSGKIDIFAFSTFNSGQRWLGFTGAQGF